MKFIASMVILAMCVGSASPLLANSPAQRAQNNQFLDFHERYLPEHGEPSHSESPIAISHTQGGIKPSGKEEAAQKPTAQECSSSSWYAPLVSAAGSILAGVAGNSLGSGAGRTAATLAGSAVGGVAANQALKAACESAPEGAK